MHKMKIMRWEYYYESTFKINKVFLSCYGDNRHALEDGVSTLAYGGEASL